MACCKRVVFTDRYEKVLGGKLFVRETQRRYRVELMESHSIRNKMGRDFDHLDKFIERVVIRVDVIKY